MALKFATLSTVNSDGDKDRNVTIAYSEERDDFTLLGALAHGTSLAIDQEFIDQLQALLDAAVEPFAFEVCYTCGAGLFSDGTCANLLCPGPFQAGE